MRDVIRIRGLRVDCVVGVYPFERDSLQPLIVDVDLHFDTERAARSERLRETLNYHAIASQIVFVLQSCRFRLLETAAHVVATMLLAPPALGDLRGPIEALGLTLAKPGALRGAATPSLTIERPREWVTLRHETKPFGTVDILHETREAGLYRLNIAPGRGIPLHYHAEMRESEMVLGEGLLVNGEPVLPGTVHRWPHRAKHRYDNPTDRWQTVLCIDSPAFIPADEIEVDGAPDPVAPEPAWAHRAD